MNDSTNLFTENSVLLLQHIKHVLLREGKWDHKCERFRVAWSEHSFSLNERLKIFAGFFAKHTVEMLSDGYTWLANEAISLDLTFYTESGELVVYSSLPIGTSFKLMLGYKMQSRFDDDADKEKKCVEQEMTTYKALLISCAVTLEFNSKELSLITKIIRDYEPADEQNNPMFQKMMGSAGGILNMINGVAESNDQIPAGIRNTLKNLTGQMNSGVETGPEGLLNMLSDAFSGSDMSSLFQQMQSESGGNPLFSKLASIMTQGGDIEEKAAQITELTGDPAILEEMQRHMNSAQ